MAPSVSRGGFHQPLDLGFGEVLAGPQLAVRRSLGGNCSIFGGWRDQPEVPFAHALCAPRADDCSDNGLLASMSTCVLGKGSAFRCGWQKAMSALPPKATSIASSSRKFGRAPPTRAAPRKICTAANYRAT